MPLNKPSPRLAILRAQLAAKAADEAFARALYRYSAQNPRTLRALPPLADSLPLPPSYWDDLEHWLKTLAPAKPAAQPCAAIITRGRVTIYTSDQALAARLASTSSAADGAALTGANPAVPAQQPAHKASTHSVCIRAYGPWKVGEVAWRDGVPQAIPANWHPCDESGWVTHVPTADSVCPVPEGIDFAAMWGNGDVSGLGSRYFREHMSAWRSTNTNGGLRAWRPIAQS